MALLASATRRSRCDSAWKSILDGAVTIEGIENAACRRYVYASDTTSPRVPLVALVAGGGNVTIRHVLVSAVHWRMSRQNNLQHYVTSFPPIGVTIVSATGGASDWLTYARRRSAEAQSKVLLFPKHENLCQMKRQNCLCAVIFKSSSVMTTNASLGR